MKRKKFAEGGEADADSSQSFGQAFAAARKADQSTFMWNGKSYHTATKEEEGYRKGGRGPLTRNGGSFPESKKNTPGGRGPLTRSSTGPDSKPEGKASTPFGVAFENAKREGKKEFDYKGDRANAYMEPTERHKAGKYTTEMKKYAKGGSVRGDGCCVKGKTKVKYR